MTWGEFKQRVEAHGVKDDDEIWFMDFHGDEESTFRVDREAECGMVVTS